MYKDIGKLDYAFSHLLEGNALRKKLLKYSITQDIEFFNKFKETQPHLLKTQYKAKARLNPLQFLFLVCQDQEQASLNR